MLGIAKEIFAASFKAKAPTTELGYSLCVFRDRKKFDRAQLRNGVGFNKIDPDAQLIIIMALEEPTAGKSLPLPFSSDEAARILCEYGHAATKKDIDEFITALGNFIRTNR